MRRTQHNNLRSSVMENLRDSEMLFVLTSLWGVIKPQDSLI